MAYGLKVFDALGGIVFDSETYSWRWADTFSVGSTASGSKTYTDLVGRTLNAMSIGVNFGGGHKVTVSGNVVTWTVVTLPSPPWNYPNSASTIFVFVR